MSALRCPPPVALAALALGASSAVMAVGYALDLVGLPMQPAVLAVVAAGAAFVCFRAYANPAFAPAASSCPELVAFSLVVAAIAGYLFWRAWPSLLPVTIGPDLVHHLQLIHVIQRTQRLAHDPALEPYLLEMSNYTPGSHILAATMAGWLEVDALRLVHPIAALAVALKSGMLYLVARRLIPGRRGVVHALAAPLLVLAPTVYFLGSFFEFFFFAQVVSETFAVGMLLATVAWVQTGERRDLAWFGICGAGAFLAWPVWIGPPVIALLGALLSAQWRLRARLIDAAVALGPIALVAAVHALLHAQGAAIIGSSGAVTRPSVPAFGVWFLAFAAGGVVVAARDAAARTVAVFLGAVLLQAAALAALDLRAGATSFYLPFKMIYLAILPAAVLGAVLLARLADVVAARLPRARRMVLIAPVLLAALVVHRRVPLTRPHSPITPSALAAGLWARDHTASACVDYFSAHWLTGYWLHLDVLGNPRLTDRMRAETFEFRDTVGKWIDGRGLPFAIVEDFAAVPRDARVDMIPLRRFGAAAVVQNARPAPCTDHAVPVWSLRPPKPGV